MHCSANWRNYDGPLSPVVRKKGKWWQDQVFAMMCSFVHVWGLSCLQMQLSSSPKRDESPAWQSMTSMFDSTARHVRMNGTSFQLLHRQLLPPIFGQSLDESPVFSHIPLYCKCCLCHGALPQGWYNIHRSI